MRSRRLEPSPDPKKPTALRDVSRGSEPAKAVIARRSWRYMPPRCWLSRRSERLGHNQSHFFLSTAKKDGAKSTALKYAGGSVRVRATGTTARPEKTDCVARCQPGFGTAKAVI